MVFLGLIILLIPWLSQQVLDPVKVVSDPLPPSLFEACHRAGSFWRAEKVRAMGAVTWGV